MRLDPRETRAKARARADNKTILDDRPSVLGVGEITPTGTGGWKVSGWRMGHIEDAEHFTAWELVEIRRLKAEGRLVLKFGELVWRELTREEINEETDNAIAELIEIARSVE